MIQLKPVVLLCRLNSGQTNSKNISCKFSSTITMAILDDREVMDETILRISETYRGILQYELKQYITFHKKFLIGGMDPW